MINIQTIWENQKPTGDIIFKTRIDGLPHLHCYAATNHITGQHLYIMTISKNVEVPALHDFRFKGVEIFIITLEEHVELNIYLIDNDLKDIFSLFIQNILQEVATCITESEALRTTFNVITKWKKLFDKVNFNGLSAERQKGLLGELLFINHLLDLGKLATNILDSWKGPEFEDRDFVFGLIGIEVKLTSSKHPKIAITSERQLDAQNLNELFLVLYSTEEVRDNGFSLNSLIKQIQQKLIGSMDALGNFNEKLKITGYMDDDADQYNKMYSVKKTFSFFVAPDFPKVIKSQLPLGIYDTSYFIELSAAEGFIIDHEQITQKI